MDLLLQEAPAVGRPGDFGLAQTVFPTSCDVGRQRYLIPIKREDVNTCVLQEIDRLGEIGQQSDVVSTKYIYIYVGIEPDFVMSFLWGQDLDSTHSLLGMLCRSNHRNLSTLRRAALRALLTTVSRPKTLVLVFCRMPSVEVIDT